jgi:hypothetical protein
MMGGFGEVMRSKIKEYNDGERLGHSPSLF